MSDKDAFHEKHIEYSKLLKYPPFTISLKKSGDFRGDILKEEDRVCLKNVGEKLFNNPDLESKVKFD